MTKDSYGYPTKIPTKITDLYGGDSIPTIEDIPTSDDIVEEIEEYLDVDLATEGQVLTMGTDGIVEWDDVASGGGMDYSTTEQDTGIKWIDGKEIYCRTFTVNHSDVSVLHIWDADIDIQLINSKCYTYSSSSTQNKYVSLGYASGTKYSSIRQAGNQALLEIGSEYRNSIWHSIVTLYYTKG